MFSSILALILPILSKLPGMAGDYFSKKQQIEQLKLENQYKIEAEKQNLIAELARSDSDRAKEALSSTTPTFKHFVFWMLSSPFIACLLGYPDYAQMVFKNLNSLPEWYLIIYTGIIGVIFGIPVPGSIMGNIWEGLKQARANTREYKLAKINRQALANTLRSSDGPLDQTKVDLMDKIADIIDKDGFGNKE